LSATINSRPGIIDYISVLKPKETSLLVFIGACAALFAASSLDTGFPAGDFALTIIALALGSAGANGLTNYLDRDVDAKMKRTCTRALASKKIDPPQKALPLIILFIAGGLVSAWLLSPVCFAIGLAGILVSGIWRKTISCTFLGIIAGSAPVLIGWYAITGQPAFDILPVLFFCLIAAWTPIHVWTLMMANRSDYEGAGLHYFPLAWEDKDVIKILAVLSLVLSIVALMIYLLSGKLHWLYLCVSSILSLVMIYANVRLLFAPSSQNAWSVYRLSAFPYLGIIFLVMVIDSWVL